MERMTRNGKVKKWQENGREHVKCLRCDIVKRINHQRIISLFEFDPLAGLKINSLTAFK